MGLYGVGLAVFIDTLIDVGGRRRHEIIVLQQARFEEQVLFSYAFQQGFITVENRRIGAHLCLVQTSVVRQMLRFAFVLSYTYRGCTSPRLHTEKGIG